MRLLHRNYPIDEKTQVGVVIPKDEEILVQVVLRDPVKPEAEVFVQGILAYGRPVKMTAEEFAGAALEAAESYMNRGALAFPLCRPGERPRRARGREQG